MVYASPKVPYFFPRKSLLFATFREILSEWVKMWVFFPTLFFFSGPRFWVSEYTLNFFWEKKYKQKIGKNLAEKKNSPRKKKKSSEIEWVSEGKLCLGKKYGAFIWTQAKTVCWALSKPIKTGHWKVKQMEYERSKLRHGRPARTLAVPSQI